jgi:hypothetical protein
MPSCASVRKRGSLDQCPLKALNGHTLCGVHARTKSVTLWAVVNQGKVGAATRLQAWIRGVLLRRRLRLGGPGVLRRTGLSNDEDLVTCESSDRQYPLDYFAFEENGKIWWFDFGTLWKWAQRSTEPANPYTKVPLSVETRTRLRKVWSYRRRHRELTPLDPRDVEERLTVRWTIISQAVSDCGFGSLPVQPFLQLGTHDYVRMFRFLRDDVAATLPGNVHAGALIHRCLMTAWSMSPDQIALQCSYALMAMLCHTETPFPLAFCILSALYRL